MIRKLNKTDLPSAVEFLKLCSVEVADWGELNKVDTYHFLDQALDNDAYYLIVYTDNEKIVGMGGMLKVPNPFNISVKQYMEVIWHSHPQLSTTKRARIMCKLFDEMMKSTPGNISAIFFTSNNVNNIGDYLERKGFELHEKYYKKRV